MATTQVSARSSWISSVKYLQTLPGFGSRVLVVFPQDGSGAWVYREVPSTLPGLLTAGQATTKTGSKQSIGATFHRLVKGRYDELYVKDQEMVEALRQI
jgi:hypothetical protein